MAALTIFTVTQGIFFVAICGILVIPVMIMTAIIRPYRKSIYNVIDLVLFLAFMQICFSTIGIGLLNYDESFLLLLFTNIMLGFGFIVPFVYITLLAVYKILPSSCIVRLMELTHTALHCLCLQQSTVQRRDR